MDQGAQELARDMFTKDGISELHKLTHESLDILLQRASSVSMECLWQTLAGFGHPTVWEQLIHILEVEESWVCDLQNRSFARWREENCRTMETLLQARERVRNATRAYVDTLSETQLNTRLTERPTKWFGELKSPAFILLHVITHTFHHKGQVVAMLRMLGYPAPDTDLQRS
jgi:uncharacterized damage-inducible protein DinB